MTAERFGVAMAHMEAAHDGYSLSSDPARQQIAVIHGFLSRSYWAEGVSEEIVRRSMAHSLCFGVFARDGAQVGFARVISDRTTFAYLADVFVLEEHRGRGLAERLMRMVVAHPDLQGLRRFMLCTKDAHGLYVKAGFSAVAKPEILMEKVQLDLYRRRAEAPAS